MPKIILFNNQARELLIKGVNLIANAVKVTLGAKGRTVLIGREFNQAPQVTKDGVTVARAVFSNDPLEEMGCVLMKEVCQKTAADAGDGTTTACVLAQSIINEGAKHLSAGMNVIEIKSGIDKAVAACVDTIKKLAKPIDVNGEDLMKIATISANGDAEIGKLISETIGKIGRDGVIHVEASLSNETKVKIEEGMEFNTGFFSGAFVNAAGRGIACEFTNPFVLVTYNTISELSMIMPLMIQVAEYNKNQVKKGEAARGLFIICEDLIGEAFKTLTSNMAVHNQGTGPGFISCAVRTPGFGEMKQDLLEDIAILCDTTVISDYKGKKVSQLGLADLGNIKKVRAEKSKTIIIGTGVEEKVKERVATIREQLALTKIEGEKDSYKLRIAKLTSGVALLSVGGFSEMEAMEKRDRIDDAACATRSAIDEGIVAGGGVTYLSCFYDLDKVGIGVGDELLGIEIVRHALTSPYEQIMKNAGMVSPMPARRDEYGTGYNVKTGQRCNLIDAGIIDPAKVTRVALENAASVAGTFLTTECVISPQLATLPKKYENDQVN